MSIQCLESHDTQVIRSSHIVSQYADILQIDTRNMQNFDLLETVGKYNKPVLLKRGMQNTIEEWLLSTEYILQKRYRNVILCERGFTHILLINHILCDITKVEN